jgi:hypothetical protein
VYAGLDACGATLGRRLIHVNAGTSLAAKLISLAASCLFAHKRGDKVVVKSLAVAPLANTDNVMELQIDVGSGSIRQEYINAAAQCVPLPGSPVR